MGIETLNLQIKLVSIPFHSLPDRRVVKVSTRPWPVDQPKVNLATAQLFEGFGDLRLDFGFPAFVKTHVASPKLGLNVYLVPENQKATNLIKCIA